MTEQPERYMVMIDFPGGRHDFARSTEDVNLPWVTTNRLDADRSAAAWQKDVGDTSTMRVVRQTDCRFSIDAAGEYSVYFEVANA